MRKLFIACTLLVCGGMYASADYQVIMVCGEFKIIDATFSGDDAVDFIKSYEERHCPDR